MSPWWYYAIHASTGLVHWIAVALSTLADVLPQKFRAPGIGLLLSGFLLGFSLAPILAFGLTKFQLSVWSLVAVGIGLGLSVTCVPETLPPEVAAETKRQRELEALRQEDEEDLEEDEGYPATPQQSRIRMPKYALRILRFLQRPIREMAILNRDTFFRLISLLAFFSGMVSSGDQVLLVYYLEERLAFTTQDISVVFLIMGITGLFAQAVLLKPLNDLLGEKWVVAACFALGAVDNIMYGLARNKGTIYAAVALSAFTGMAFPTISAIKANNVAATEQGRIQGALYSLSALASGVGPVVLRTVYQAVKSTAVGPGAMFVFAGCLYWIAVAVACALPPERANAQRASDDLSDDAWEGDNNGAEDDAGDPAANSGWQPLASDCSEDSTGSYGSIS
jgi:DHA1 family tetracycline resistance protein-like MFS transporter